MSTENVQAVLTKSCHDAKLVIHEELKISKDPKYDYALEFLLSKVNEFERSLIPQLNSFRKLK